ncbi:MAG: energy transducer TonB [Saprospiraceae bacterium]|nr:energy transducer TonB [Saprospiraceae bacterium]
MKNIHYKLIALLFIAFAFPYAGSSQNSSVNELQYEVNRIYPYISITKEKLKEAHTLIDLNKDYKSSWIRAYISVEILTSYKGKIRKAVSKNATLSQEQKDMIHTADAGTDISVKVQYLPENTLKYNDIKEMDFTLTVNPDNEAIYPGGQQELKQYLKETAIDNIPEGSFKGYELAAVKFTIDEEGQIMDAHLFWSSKNEKIDKLLLETIRNMPNWKPAAYANGRKVKQEFVFTVGNMESCVIPLLNIRQS